ncbi:MAG: hypothetical protein U0795_24930 [Pirellulales bacterium]
MAISAAIRSAVEATFAADQQLGVLDRLSTIPEPSPVDLRLRPEAEYLQAAVVVLAYGDLGIFDGQVINACVEPRDVIYVLQSPGWMQPGLTRQELVRRYRELKLPVPDLLAADA